MRARWAALSTNTRLVLRLLLIAAVVLILAFGALRLFRPAPRMVTMDSGGEVATINLWDDYQTRGRVTGRARPGETAQLVRQSGAGCLVRTNAGAQGWVTCASFIREFRDD